MRNQYNLYFYCSTSISICHYSYRDNYVLSLFTLPQILRRLNSSFFTDFGLRNFPAAPNQHRSFETCLGERRNLASPPLSTALPHIHSKTACRGFKSFCPCQKTGENTGFSPVSFFHVLHCYLVHFGSDFWFPHPSVPAAPLSSTQNAPDFGCFRMNSGASLFFCWFSGIKFSTSFLSTLPIWFTSRSRW